MTHVPLHTEQVPADVHVGLADHAYENRPELAEMQTDQPLCHALFANFQAFHIACYRKYADAEG